MSGLLPDPPGEDTRWSVITLAEHLAVLPGVVDALLAEPDTDGMDSPDLDGARYGYSYAIPGAGGAGDCWLTEEAAERIAAQLPAARIARGILGLDPTQPTWKAIDGPALRALAEHVLTHGGAA